MDTIYLAIKQANARRFDEGWQLDVGVRRHDGAETFNCRVDRLNSFLQIWLFRFVTSTRQLLHFSMGFFP